MNGLARLGSNFKVAKRGSSALLAGIHLSLIDQPSLKSAPYLSRVAV